MAGRAGRAVWAGKAGKATRCDTDRFFQSIHHHQSCIDLEDFYIAEQRKVSFII